MNRRRLGTITAIGLGGAAFGACSIPPIPQEPGAVALPPETTTTIPSVCTFPVDDPTSVLSVVPTYGQFWNVYVDGHSGSIGQVEAQTTSDALSAAFDVEETVCTAQTFTPPEVTIPYGSGTPVPGGNSGSTGSTGSTGNTGNSGGY
jgi:hypothetical protein